MRFASLGSGSQGNALVIALPGAPAGGPRRFVLIDCGFNRRETQRRLQGLGLTLEGLAGVFVTHEHSDHIAGVFRVAAAADAPVYLTHGTMEAARRCAAGFDADRCRVLVPDRAVDVGDLSLLPFAVPHDAREPVQYVIDDGRSRLGVLTDVGRSTPHLIERLGGVQTLVLECNHDRELLSNGRYPVSLKRRVGGDFGHLANDAAAEILAAVDKRRLRRVIAAHLSEENNRPELARRALATALACRDEEIVVADQADGLRWQLA